MFKKRFVEALAPALLLHIILVLISGLTIERLSPGIYGGISLAIGVGVVLVVKNRELITPKAIIEHLTKQLDEGLLIFLLTYVFFVIINSGKRFLYWDEYSHWGIMLKESLRLDRLYCSSPLSFVHKDYVPAITLAEVIWSRLSGGFYESDTYRGLQTFMFALLMPVTEVFYRDAEKRGMTRFLRQAGATVLVLLIPLFFNGNNAFLFYHSIYIDFAVAILFFYCTFEAWKTYDNDLYRAVVLTIGLTVLVMSKMTAMALLPMVLFLFLLIRFFDRGERISATLTVLLPAIIIPVATWVFFNWYVDRFVPNTGGAQSYDSVNLLRALEVFGLKEPTIPYLSTVKKQFMQALLFRDVLVKGPYLAVLIATACILFFAARVMPLEQRKRNCRIASVWIIICGLGYAALMLFLYATAFGEFEATILASYERYMNTFVVAAIFLALAILFDSEIWKQYKKGYQVFIAALLVDVFILRPGIISPMISGILGTDDDNTTVNVSHATRINEGTPEDARVLVIKSDYRDPLAGYDVMLQYYCNPRKVHVSIAGIVNATESKDELIKSFTQELHSYDYLYVDKLEDIFFEIYGEVVEGLDMEYQRLIKLDWD